MNEYILGIHIIFVRFEFAYLKVGSSQKLIGYIYASKRFQNYILYCKLKVWVSAIQLDNFFFQYQLME